MTGRTANPDLSDTKRQKGIVRCGMGRTPWVAIGLSRPSRPLPPAKFRIRLVDESRVVASSLSVDGLAEVQIELVVSVALFVDEPSLGRLVLGDDVPGVLCSERGGGQVREGSSRKGGRGVAIDVPMIRSSLSAVSSAARYSPKPCFEGPTTTLFRCPCWI